MSSYNLEDEMDFQCAEEIPINETRIIGLPMGDEKSGNSSAIANNNINNLNALSVNEYLRK
jgi:hypothetical protein